MKAHRVCKRCGRVGTRLFRHTLDGVYVCTSRRACDERIHRADVKAGPAYPGEPSRRH